LLAGLNILERGWFEDLKKDRSLVIVASLLSCCPFNVCGFLSVGLLLSVGSAERGALVVRWLATVPVMFSRVVWDILDRIAL
jgi:hypothetical protein